MPSDANDPAGSIPDVSVSARDEREAFPSATARKLVREAWKASLATISRSGGYPYGSLVAVACEPDGSPLLLLSGLAEHTRNIHDDQRVSLLFDGTDPGPAALTGARVTLVGKLGRTESETARRRYLSRHPDAVQFIDFGDFALFALDVEWGHLVAGFGRIQRLTRADLIAPVDDALDLVAAEPDILGHMNTDHADAVAIIAQRRSDAQPTSAAPISTAWTMVGCDPAGYDLVCGSLSRRIDFSHRVRTLDEVRGALAADTRAARLRRSGDDEN